MEGYDGVTFYLAMETVPFKAEDRVGCNAPPDQQIKQTLI